MDKYLIDHGFKPLDGYDATMQNFDTSDNAYTRAAKRVATEVSYGKSFDPRLSPMTFVVAKLTLSDKKCTKTPLMKLVASIAVFFEMLGRVKIGILIAFCVDIYRSIMTRRFTLNCSKANILAIYDAGKTLMDYYSIKEEATKEETKAPTTTGKENDALKQAFLDVQSICK